ncbi:peptidoglycan DD-metalloendopeptidase family protein [Sporolactobacillus sp. CPB3-1]|uniref:Peptidoglycan DD-metalloendopeptidase family protein n=1 Tax=Sporolactobacillus mangiferae TaxID=2940498 RepID=A0ABT0MCZ7_9BACL|nr:M23 family metallopeptidase [Sporolactobacillus mangiferae]MCL1632543.1 peptidoglycan DD-metalloendopeptidase family protein [Sporolactobacillus mangiferae]
MKLKMNGIAAVCLSCTLAWSITGIPVHAESQSELKAKLNAIQSQKKENTNQISESKQKLTDNQEKQDTIVSNLKESEKKITSTNQKIEDTSNRVQRNQRAMAELKSEIKKIDKRIQNRNQLLKGRLRSIYISGGAVRYLDVLFGSKSFGNFLDRLLALKMITDQDNRIITDQKKDKQAQKTKQKRLRAVLVQTSNDLHELQTMKNDLDQEKAHKQELLAGLKDQASDIEKTMMSSKEQAGILGAQESVIKKQLADQQAKARADAAAKAEVEKKKADEKKAASADHNRSVTVTSTTQTSAETTDSNNSSSSSSQGMFVMPAAGYISSGFGYRTFDGEFHPGIDIANSTGTPIHAAADGIVFRAYQSSSYGNCVMISHVINGQLYTTVYAHLSAIYVSDGQSVSQGQSIGAMGNTGESSGSHLHFELYKGRWTPPPHNGAVNPLNFLN